MRAGLTHSALFLALVGSRASFALPLESKNAESVRVSLGHKAKEGIGVRPSPSSDGGWRLQLGHADANTIAQIIDVTPGTPARMLAVTVWGDELQFDSVRFFGGHVYLVQLRRSESTVASGLVYLFPAAPRKEPRHTGELKRIKFVPGERSASDEIQPIAKDSL